MLDNKRGFCLELMVILGRRGNSEPREMPTCTYYTTFLVYISLYVVSHIATWVDRRLPMRLDRTSAFFFPLRPLLRYSGLLRSAFFDSPVITGVLAFLRSTIWAFVCTEDVVYALFHKDIV